jgi:hypothetical protein
VIIGLAAIALLFRVADWSARRSHALPYLPQTNGYTQVLLAAGKIQLPAGDYAELTPEQIHRFAATNRPAIDDARKALPLASSVTLATTNGWEGTHQEELKKLKRLAVALAIEGRSETLNHDTNASARWDLDAIRLAHTMRQGGVWLDAIDSMMVETIADAALQSKIPNLDLEFCHEATLALETLDSRDETPATIIATEKSWAAKRFGLTGSFMSVVMRKGNAERQAKFTRRYYDLHNRTQRLMIRLAMRVYELDKQHSPTKISDLVPVYLSQMPHDLETGKEIQELPAVIQ